MVSSEPNHTFASLLKNLQVAGTLHGLEEARKRLPDIVGDALASGTTTLEITGFLSEMADAALKKLIEWALDDWGPAPVEFAFLVMGSQCRKEMTLNADQDNALVYNDGPYASRQNVGDYFLRLGERLCGQLDQLGYPLCEGGFMAQNPDWCQPLSSWRGYYENWILGFDPESQVRFGLFFDFRAAAGDAALEATLRSHLLNLISQSRGFLFHLLETAREYDVPLSRFGKIKVRKNKTYHNLLDIKHALEPVVFMTRVLAYQNGIKSTNTLIRLRELGEQGFLDAHICRNMIEGYRLMMTIRLKNQINRKNQLPEHFVSLGELSADDRYMLKEALRSVRELKRELTK